MIAWVEEKKMKKIIGTILVALLALGIAAGLGTTTSANEPLVPQYQPDIGIMPQSLEVDEYGDLITVKWTIKNYGNPNLPVKAPWYAKIYIDEVLWKQHYHSWDLQYLQQRRIYHSDWYYEEGIKPVTVHEDSTYKFREINEANNWQTIIFHFMS